MKSLAILSFISSFLALASTQPLDPRSGPETIRLVNCKFYGSNNQVISVDSQIACEFFPSSLCPPGIIPPSVQTPDPNLSLQTLPTATATALRSAESPMTPVLWQRPVMLSGKDSLSAASSQTRACRSRRISRRANRALLSGRTPVAARMGIIIIIAIEMTIADFMGVERLALIHSAMLFITACSYVKSRIEKRMLT